MSLSIAFDQLFPFDMQLSGLLAYAVVDQKSGSSYQTRKISFDSIAEQLSRDLSSIRSAAYCMSSEFALSGHDHDIYTSASYEPENIPGSSEKRKVAVLNLSSSNAAGQHIYSTSVELVVEAVDKHDDPYVDVSAFLPKLGTVKFISIDDLDSISSSLDFNNSKFMGWVKANGAQYKLSDFALSDDIVNVMSVDTGRQYFKVPCLSSFMRMASSKVDDGSYAVHSGNNTIMAHSHAIQPRSSNSYITFKSTKVDANPDEINQTLSGLILNTYRDPTFTVNLKPPSVTGTAITGMHYGKNDDDNFPIYMESTSSLKDQHIDNMPLINSAGSNDAPYPTHNIMPAVVYVGVSKHSQLSNFIIKM